MQGTNKQQEIKPATKLEEALGPKEKEKSKNKKETQIVEGIFKNWEVRGAPITFSYYSKAVCDKKGVPKKYTLEDGKKYKLPFEVARHINTCAYPTSKAEVDKKGHYTGKRDAMVRRYTFRRVDDLMDSID